MPATTKKLRSALLVLASFALGAAGETYKSRIENPIVRYKMSAKLDPAAKIVKGRYKLTWWNHTDETISDLYFHLYLNAFKNIDSTFMRERLLSRRSELLKEWTETPEERKWGWVEIDRIQIAGGEDLSATKSYVQPDDGNSMDQTVMRIVLPRPVPPRGTIELEVDFTSKLPRALARTGYKDDYFFVAQWFPKIGVYEGPGERGREQGGWNCHQFHTNTEFYADYGVYDVELTVPSHYVVGATGFRRSERKNPDGTTTYNFYQEDVHDFAWTASPDFLRIVRTFDWRQEVEPEELASWGRMLGLPPEEMALRDVEVILLLQPSHRHLADRYFRAAFAGLKYFGLWYGQYPYDTLTVVDPARGSNSGGMEYPTLITGGTHYWPGKHSFTPEGVTVHEFGHQFWYGLVGNNEFEEAWLDEGFTVYSTDKVLEAAYGRGCQYVSLLGIPVPAFSWLRVKPPAFPFAGLREVPVGPYLACYPSPRSGRRNFYVEHAKDDQIVRNGWEYADGASYSVNSYIRTALTLETLERYLGPETMARILRTYHQRWRYRHPGARDFFNVVNEVSGRDMNWFFQQFFYGANVVDYAVGSITSEPVEGKIGIYDEDGKKVPYLEKAAKEAFAKSKEKVYRSTVLIRRMGEVIAPVDVLIRFENGEVVREQWDGQYRWVRYTYDKPSKVQSAEVDIARKLLMDTNLTNNTLSAEPDARAAQRWYVRWIFWLENLFFLASFFG